MIGRETGARLAAAAHDAEPHAKIRSAVPVSRRVTGRPHSRNTHRPDYARDGRCASVRHPHYWLDPDNVAASWEVDRRGLDAHLTEQQGYFDQRYADFDRRLADAQKRWAAAMAPYKGTKVVTYHRRGRLHRALRSRCNRLRRAKARHSASPSHTINLIAEMKRQNVKLILVEPYFDLKTPESIARETVAR